MSEAGIPNRDEVTIAALLHDIGKFAQRTGLPDLESTDMEGHLCPTSHRHAGAYTHRHVLYTEGFLRKFRELLAPHGRPETIIGLAGRHHRPDNPFDHIISTADRISAGADRSDRELEGERRRVFYETPLISIFEKIERAERGPAARPPRCHPLAPLDPETVSPTAGIEVNAAGYLDLWRKFEADFAGMVDIPTNQFIRALVSLLARYTWCIPSSTIDEPDISLFDHSLTSAAFAAVLHGYHTAVDDWKEAAIVDSRHPKFLFVTGDLSGIQDYIFNIKSDANSAKLLRARSFELQLLADSGAAALLEEMELPPVCALMNAGGRFLLVLPNTTKAQARLDAARLSIERFFIERYQGELALNLSAGLPASWDELKRQDGKAIDLIERIQLEAAAAKHRRFQAALAADGHLLEAAYAATRSAGALCPICERNAAGRGEDGACRQCESLIRLGGLIPKASYLRFNHSGRGFGLYGGLAVELSVQPGPFTKDGWTAAINKFEPGLAALQLPYHLPAEGESILTFQEISEESAGTRKLAMFKADVDGLGWLFSRGLDEQVSISRLASFSRQLNYFFSAIVNETIRRDFPLLYTVFSGGDDLCVLGPWDRIMAFAADIRGRFSDFVGPGLSLSGGIALANAALPVRAIAHAAEDMLKRAKDTEGKNRIGVFSVDVPWEAYRRMLDFGNELAALVRAGHIGAGFVHRLLGYEGESAAFDGGDMTKALWRSHLVYDAARNIEDASLRTTILERSVQDIAALRVAASQALYQLREKE